MNEQNREIPYVQEFDGIDFKALFRKLFREWRVILKWCGVAIVLALIVGFSVPKKFTVTSRMSLESSSGSGGGGGTLSALAGMAGINLGSLTSSTDAISPELYPEILSSTPFALELFPLPVEFKDRKGETLKMPYYEYVRDYMRKPWWNAVIHAPSAVLGWFLGLFVKKTEKDDAASGIFDIALVDPRNLTLEEAAVTGDIWKSISWSVDKKTSAIRLSVSAQNPDVALQVSEAVVSLLQQYLTDYRTEKARRDLAYYEQLYEEAKTDYFRAQQRYADFMDRNQSIITQRGRAEQDRLKNEVSLTYSLYTSCAQQVQTAKAKVQFDTPAFNMIEPPHVPLTGKPSKKILLAVFIFVGALLSMLWILWGRDAWADVTRKDEEDKA